MQLSTPTPPAPPAATQSAATAARQAGPAELAQALQGSHRRTLALFAAFERALPGLAVPLAPDFNPPLWELGHIAWFQDWWIARNRHRARGLACEPEHARVPSRLARADAFYNSSLVPHDSRWALPLPGADATRAYLRAVLDDTLALLGALADGKPRHAPSHAGDAQADLDNALYFFRLVLFHEDMHAEAAVYMAQALGIVLPVEAAYPGRLHAMRPASVAPAHNNVPAALRLPARAWQLGSAGAGFCFDNERAAHAVEVAAFEIDAESVTWARYLPFAEAGGYTEPRWWSPEGWQWLQQTGQRAPRYLRHGAQGWQCQMFGSWQALDPSAPAVHLSWHEAQAWCRWAGRRLPTEAEWECAALTQPVFHWGAVWDWTASSFEAYPGFTPHPYRDYSAPWFGSRRVLRGACAATAPRMAHPRYRNFFTPERNDIFAGFRSCALG